MSRANGHKDGGCPATPASCRCCFVVADFKNANSHKLHTPHGVNGDDMTDPHYKLSADLLQDSDAASTSRTALCCSMTVTCTNAEGEGQGGGKPPTAQGGTGKS